MSVTDERVIENVERSTTSKGNDHLDIPKIVKQIEDLLRSKGAKPETLRNVNIKGFVSTCFATLNLGRTDEVLNGYRLDEYKLDPRFKGLVLPRGVYVDESRLAKKLNFGLGDPEKIEVLSPTSFGTVQTQIVNLLRTSESLTTTLLAESESQTLAMSADKAVSDGSCHYDPVAYLPIDLAMSFYDTTFYNFPVEDMVEEFIRASFVSWTKSNS